MQHRVHSTRGLANPNHLSHHVGKYSRFAQRIDYGAAFFDGFADLHQCLFQYGIPRGPGGNAQPFQDGNARGNQGPQGTGKARHRDLAQQHTQNGQLEQGVIEVVPTLGVFANLFDTENNAGNADDEKPPELANKRA